MTDIPSEAVTVEWADLPARLTLKRMWVGLEAQSDSSFFTSWTWISVWLDSLPPRLRSRLVVARRGEQIVGLGLLVAGWRRIARVLPVRCWFLHESGVESIDSVTIEHNGFLVARDAADETRAAMLAFVLRGRWPRLTISGATAVHGNVAAGLALPVAMQLRERAVHHVDLAQVRACSGGYSGMLGPNARAQIRRSRKAYCERGTLALDVAGDVATALAYLERLCELHTKAWQEHGVDTEFGNVPVALDFHRRLIEAGHACGEVQLLRATVAGEELGYLYNFVHRGRVCYYQSGLRYGVVPKQDRPGYVTHALAVEHYAREGLDAYDFLAGEQRYKKALGTARSTMLWCTFERRSWLSDAEAQLRRVATSVRRARRASRGAAAAQVGD